MIFTFFTSISKESFHFVTKPSISMELSEVMSEKESRAALLENLSENTHWQ